MEEAKNNNNNMSVNLKRTLTITSCLLLILGHVGGPLIARLYFVHGGSRDWLTSFLETAGFPILLLPLLFSYLSRRRRDPTAKITSITLPVFAACAVLGLATGLVDFLYASGLSFLPVSTSALLNSTQLSFTALFAFLIVKQRLTACRLNAVALLTTGAVLLGLHAGGDRPAGESKGEYVVGFFLTLGASALNALVLPLVELTYAKAERAITYTLVMEIQFVISCSATLFCLVGMMVKNDFQAIPKEAMDYGLGETKYYVVLSLSAVIWQLYFLGAAGTIFCVNTLFTGIVISLCLPMTGLLGVILYREKFSSEKYVALLLSLWGMASYSYGEYLESKPKKTDALEAQT